MNERDIARFVAKMRVDERGHWLWLGAPNKKTGYGSFFIERKKQYAHRVAYTLFRGPIPHGCEIDHLCRVRMCVNPSRLEAVDHLTNVRRGSKVMKLFCSRGHPRTDANLYTVPATGLRYCRVCHREKARKCQ